MKRKNLISLMGGAFLAILLVMACQKQAIEPKDSLTNEKVKSSVLRTLEDCEPAEPCEEYQGTVVGANQTPGPPPYTNWGHKYYSFGQNAQVDPPDEGCAEVDFNSIFNSTITATSGWKIGYIQVPLADNIADIDCCWENNIITGSSLNMGSIGENTTTTPGWFNYDTLTHIPTPVANRYVVVWNGSGTVPACGDVIYVLQITSVTTNPVPTPGFPGPYQPTYVFDYKRIQVCDCL